MSKYIKNADSVTHTWHGKEFAVGEYHLIPPASEISWINNSTLLTAIANGEAVVAKDDSGSNDISDINDAINYLKNNQPIEISSASAVHTYALNEGGTLRARLVGIYNQTVTKNTTTTLDWAIPQTTYLGANKDSYMDGISYLASNGEAGDKMTFQVVDKDGLVYPTNTVLDEFGKDWAVTPDIESTIRLYKAKLIPGMYIRIIYVSVGTTNDVHFVANLFRHMDTQ